MQNQRFRGGTSAWMKCLREPCTPKVSLTLSDRGSKRIGSPVSFKAVAKPGTPQSTSCRTNARDVLRQDIAMTFVLEEAERRLSAGFDDDSEIVRGRTRRGH